MPYIDFLQMRTFFTKVEGSMEGLIKAATYSKPLHSLYLHVMLNLTEAFQLV